MSLAVAIPEPRGQALWPDDDTVVLRHRLLRLGAGTGSLSRFGDEVWHLKPAHPDAHVSLPPLSWQRFPPGLVPAFKAFFLAALDHPYPAGPGVQRPGERASVATFHYWFTDLRLFAHWLTSRGIAQLCEVTDQDLEAYRGHVLGLARAAGRKADMLAVIRTLWLYRSHLPAPARLATAYPWAGASAKNLVALPPPGRENKTPRIAPATMDGLLAWVLRMIEHAGPDIRDAWLEYRQLDCGIHPSQAGYSGTLGDRLPVFLERTRQAGGCLPGRPDGHGGAAVNFGHILRLAGIPEARRAGLTAAQGKLIAEAGLPVAAGTYLGSITGRINGRPWRQTPITAGELPTLVRLLFAAGFITVCYLSGMRPGEALNLARGCRDTDPETGELLVRGRRGKGFDRTPYAPAAADPGRAWTVVTSVHTAIALLEDLADGPFLFPASPVSPHALRPNHANARSCAAINKDIDDFVTWVNTAFCRADGTLPIPPDPTKHLHATRLRRTLAYFIVRRPRGLIAAALQYGHVHAKVTLSYAGDADTSWMNDLAVERLEMVLEQIEQDTALLGSGEHVSGPAAQEYRSRVGCSARFAGQVISQVRNIERLLTQADPGIHHGEAMTCVWHAPTAACRQARLEAGLPASESPEEAECRSGCRNLAYTDRDIGRQRTQAAAWQAQAADPMAPQPLRDRAAALAGRAQAIIGRHEDGQNTPEAEGAA